MTFDYIIVGGGSAGCVLANRLSARPTEQICLLEAGPADTNPFILMPMGIFMVIKSKVLNWHFSTTAQKDCANRSLYWPRGRTLGGSSSINAMCYLRGHPHDYDAWAKLGNNGWAFKDVLPYFKKLENFEPDVSRDQGVGGPMNVTKSIYLNPLMHAFVQAGQQAGYAVNNYNEQAEEGVGYFYVSEKGGQRCSNARAYLHPIIKRQNLTIFTNAHATKIIFDGKRAIGVRYSHRGQFVDIYARKEVILCAGAIGSPQLLLLSGVGPRAEIEKHGIELVHDLSGVGENLHDHLDIHITCLDKTHTTLSFNFSAWWRLITDGFQYFYKHRGELTSNYAQAVGFAKTNPNLPTPNLQWHFAASVYTNSATELKSIFKYYGYTLMTCLLHPKSRGRITLASADPLAQPMIDPHYLANESDLDALVMGFKKSRELLAQDAFKPYFLREYEPGEHIQTDEQIKDYIRRRAETIYHPVGTCKMGRDAMAVVDPLQLKVYGLQNLRVIDASIMPLIISGNTNAPTTMIAEKGADMILQGDLGI